MRAFVTLCWMWWAGAVAAPAGSGGANLIANAGFRGAGAAPEGWRTWAPRAALAPEARVAGSGPARALEMRSRKYEDYGKWMTTVSPVAAGSAYRFEVEYQPAGILHERVSVAAIVTWSRDEDGAQAVQRDYLDRLSAAGQWRRLSRELRAPEGARAAILELVLRWTRRGAVRWRNPRVSRIDNPPRRLVRVATTRLNPKGPDLNSNLRRMAELLDQAGRQKPDVICLGETLATWGLQEPLAKLSEPIPGPLTSLLAEKARRYRTYIVAGIDEAAGGLLYNTAVVIGRDGALLGRYRKTHLPMREGENGVTPGSAYPVVDTDFGRIGVLICWDFWFPEPARILRLKGAEIIFLPIAGDGDARHWDVISRARAMDNGVYLVSANVVGKSPSRIIAPDGEVLAETAEGAVVAADLDLNQEWRTFWLATGPSFGEGKSLYIQERRPDTYGTLIESAGRSDR